MWTKSPTAKGIKSTALGTAAVAILICFGVATTSQAQIIVSDTYTRPDNSALGTTEVGAVAYGEFNTSGGNLTSQDIAKIESGRLRITGPAGSSTDPGMVRLVNLGFDLDVTAVVTMLGDNYNPLAVANDPVFIFRQMNVVPGKQGSKGLVQLDIRPNGTYRVLALTSSPPPAGDGAAQVVADAPIGPAFAAADTDGDGIIESNEPFTVRIQVIGDTFCWFMNGVEIGCFLLPDAAITGVDQTQATNFFFGRNRVVGGAVPDLEIAYDNLVANPASATMFVQDHEGNADPTTEGWTRDLGTGITEGPITGDLGFDAWSIDDPTTADSSTRLYTFIPSAAVVSAALTSGWSLTARLRVVDTPENADRAIMVEFIDGTTRWRMDFGSQADGDPIVLLQTGVSGAGDDTGVLFTLEGGGVATTSMSFGTTRRPRPPTSSSTGSSASATSSGCRRPSPAWRLARGRAPRPATHTTTSFASPFLHRFPRSAWTLLQDW